MNIETALVYFLDEGIIAGKSKDTLRTYKSSLNVFLKYIETNFLPKEFDSLNSEVISDYLIYGIKIRKWNQYSQWSAYKNLKVFINWLLRKKLIIENPLTSIPKPKIPQQFPKSLNQMEALRLLRIVSSLPTKYPFYTLRNKAMIAMFLFTGLRKSELVNLKVSDVDLDSNFITVQHGKGGKKREIPIEEKILKPILEEYWAYRCNLNRVSEWFFNGVFGNHIIKDNTLNDTAIKNLFNKLSAALGKRVYPHMLRHTFSTLLLDKTGDIYTLKELLGHSDISTTCIYLSSTRTKKIEAVNKLSLIP